ncbi:ZinT family metal-binding protein [Paracoccus sp. (in: a-proteobacteria)]|uniref:ZinT family metal-binding protein n=1 Tax=Paracoccus sp. TaxID=267 RepID=UPI0035B0327F
MRNEMGRGVGAAALAVMLMIAPAMAQAEKAATAPASAHGHDHAHDHGHDAKPAADTKSVYKGYFEDSQIRDRTLADWQGDWQSVYPYLADGTLDPVMAHKAEHGDKSAAEYRAYYQTGYRTDVGRIVIAGDRVSFHRGAAVVSGQYASDGHEVLTYKKGNRGVRYVFRKVAGDAEAPQFIQFSDHAIAPLKAGHYHLYSGEDRAALLENVTNWPTYYPKALDGAQIVAEMLAH